MSIESIPYKDICDECAHKGYCNMAQFGGHDPRITACSHFAKSKQTNADRIRAMDIDHLIEWYCYKRQCGTCPYGGVECHIRDWLKQEVDKQ